MPIHITVDQAATWVAEKWLANKEREPTLARRVQILPALKYNSLVIGFNSSTALLVAAAAFAVLFSVAAAATYGSIGLMLRWTTEKELQIYGLPTLSHPAVVEGDNNSVLGGLTALAQSVRYAFNHASQNEREDNIFRNLKLLKPVAWQENEVFLFGYAIWKNRVDIPAPINQ